LTLISGTLGFFKTSSTREKSPSERARSRWQGGRKRGGRWVGRLRAGDR